MKRTEIKRTEIRRKSWGVSQKPKKPLKKSGATKAKKVDRQRSFYASAVWKRIRKAALEGAGHRCEYVLECDNSYSLRRPFWLQRLEDDGNYGDTCRCGVTADHEPLQVHHKTNVRFGGDERPEDLQVLCKEHHALVERRDHPHRTHGRAA